MLEICRQFISGIYVCGFCNHGKLLFSASTIRSPPLHWGVNKMENCFILHWLDSFRVVVKLNVLSNELEVKNV